MTTFVLCVMLISTQATNYVLSVKRIKNDMFFCLGVIIGLLIAVLLFEMLPYFSKQIASKIDVQLKKTTPKAEFLHAKTTKEIAIENLINQNEKNGGTPLGEIL